MNSAWPFPNWTVKTNTHLAHRDFTFIVLNRNCGSRLSLCTSKQDFVWFSPLVSRPVTVSAYSACSPVFIVIRKSTIIKFLLFIRGTWLERDKDGHFLTTLLTTKLCFENCLFFIRFRCSIIYVNRLFWSVWRLGRKIPNKKRVKFRKSQTKSMFWLEVVN